MIRADKKPAGEHERRFQCTYERRDIVIEKNRNQLQRVAETHRNYDSLQYPLKFWAGEYGYYFFILQTDSTTGFPINGGKVSAMNFYAYRIMIRAVVDNHILRYRQLFHQFLVDMYAKIERML
jgi:hypothetical protein